MEIRADCDGPSQTQTQGIDSPAVDRLHADSSSLWGRLISKTPGDGSIYDLGHPPRGEGEETKLSYSIGRHISCDIRVRDNRVSKEHCRIFAAYPQGRLRVFIEDSSANGTIVNETLRLRRGEKLELTSGDSLSLCADRTIACFIFVNLSQQLASLRAVSLFSHLERAPTSTAKSGLLRRIEDDYIVGDQLGYGQSGRVHICVHKQSKERFAVKVIDTRRFGLAPGLSAEEIRGEARILSSLDHPQIIKIFDTYESEGVLFIVMELVLGGDLFDRVSERGRYSEDDARQVMRSILSAVSYLHSKDIVHRDVKPENILLVSKSSDTEVKITDFGLAKKANQEGLKTFCGTPQYFAPEVLKRRNTVFGAGRYGSAADMWSIGVTLYILLSGTYPFSEQDLYSQLAQAQYSFRGQEWEGVSDTAKDLISGLMELRPEKRMRAEAALKHPWITNNSPKRDTSAKSEMPKDDSSQYSRPPVHQLSWSRPIWLSDIGHRAQQSKKSTVSDDLLAELNLMQIYPPKYKSASVAKKEMAKAKELPGDEIKDFSSPFHDSESNKRNRCIEDNGMDESFVVKKTKTNPTVPLSGSRERENSVNNTKSARKSTKSGGKRSHQMNILDAFRGLRK